jgi:magnesium transporter
VIETHVGDRRVDGIAPASEGGGMRWVVSVAPTPPEIEELARAFHIHPLAVEDIQNRNQRPKADEYGDQLFVVLFAVYSHPDSRHVSLSEVHVLVGPDYVVTVTDEEIPAISRLAGLCSRLETILGKGPGRLFHRICDAVIDSFFPVIDDLENTLDELETSIVDRADQATVRDIFDLKRELTTMRRVLGPQRDLLQGLAGPHGPLLGEEAQLYLRDVYDHAVRIVEQVDSYRDIVTTALDVYLSSVSNRLGEQTKRLSVVATIFLPLTFLTGFFGQNFGYLVSSIQTPQAFAIGLSIEVVSVVTIWYVVHRTTMAAHPLSGAVRPRARVTIGRPRLRRTAAAATAATAKSLEREDQRQTV